MKVRVGERDQESKKWMENTFTHIHVDKQRWSCDVVFIIHLCRYDTCSTRKRHELHFTHRMPSMHYGYGISAPVLSGKRIFCLFEAKHYENLAIVSSEIFCGIQITLFSCCKLMSCQFHCIVKIILRLKYFFCSSLPVYYMQSPLTPCFTAHEPYFPIIRCLCIIATIFQRPSFENTHFLPV